MLRGRTANPLVVIVILLVFLAPQAVLGWETEAAGAATATVIAGEGVVYSGGDVITLPIQVTNVQNLGAATILVSFDPTVIKATGCQRGVAFDAGLCNLNVDSDADGKADQVLFNALSLNGVSTGETPVTMASISWQAVAPVTTDATAILHLQVDTFADADGRTLAAATQDGKIVVLPPQPEVRVYLPCVRR